MSDTSEEPSVPPRAVAESSEIDFVTEKENGAKANLSDVDLEVGLSSELSFHSTMQYRDLSYVEEQSVNHATCDQASSASTQQYGTALNQNLTPSPQLEITSALESTDWRAARDRYSCEVVKPKTFLALATAIDGIFFIAEIIASFICWVSLVAWSYAAPNYRMPCPLEFSLFVFVTSWAITGMLFITLLVGLDLKYEKIAFLRSPLFGIFYNCIWACLYLVGGAIAGSKAVSDITQVLAASSALAFLVMLIHIIQALLAFQKNFGKCPWYYTTCCNGSSSS